MSEFQLYQFKSIDRPLTEAERKEIGSWSSRTYPTTTSATFSYSYGDFPKDEKEVVEKYFDAMMYAANWGTKRLIFRLPKNLIDAEELSAYTFEMEYAEDTIALEVCKSCYFLDIHFSNEGGGGWLDDNDYDLDDLTPLREDFLQGDHRALYLIWLQFATAYKEEEDDEVTPKSPPVPPNLSKLSGALKAFIDFFEIDPDLVAAAQAASRKSKSPNLDYRKLIGQLPENERIEWLFRLVNSERRIELEFKKRLQELAPAKKPAPSASPSLEEMKTLTQAKEQERLKQEAEAVRLAHIQKMKQLAHEESALWEQVSLNLLKATGSSYDKAVATLKDLQDLAAYQKKVTEFKNTMQIFREQYARKRALIRRFDRAGLD